MRKNLILIDGSSYLFRAFHALPALLTSKHHPTGAMYGVINMIKKLMQSHPYDYIAVVFDPKGKTVRHDIFKEYKANRAAMPDELRVQIQPLHDMIRAMGLPLIIQEGIEADDVIATLAVYAEKQGIDTLISTMDKDLAQIVNAHITIINTMSNRFYDVAGVKEKFGVMPAQIIDYLALIGDTSDNIPGIPKVGPKTAVTWLEKYHSVDNIVKHAADITGKVGENLRNNLDNLALSKQLVTIDLNVPVKIDLSDLQKKSEDIDKLRELFAEYEFNSWLKGLHVVANVNVSIKTPSNTPSQYTAIQDEQAFLGLLDKLEKAKTFSLDTETNSIDAMQAELVGMSFCIAPHEAFYIPFLHRVFSTTQEPILAPSVAQTEASLSSVEQMSFVVSQAEALSSSAEQMSFVAPSVAQAEACAFPNQLNRAVVLKKLMPILQNKHTTLIGQNIKFDYKVLKNHGLSIEAAMEDTMLESYVLNSTASRHDLDTLALKYLSHHTIKFEDVAGSGVKQVTFDHVPIDKATAYAAEDADIALQLHHTFMQKIHADPASEKILTTIEWPLMRILAEMEFAGVLIDVEKLHAQSAALEKRIAELQTRAFELANETFNLSSPKQLQTILFDKMKLPVIKKTPTGSASTDESVMQELAYEYELPKIIMEHRQCSKLKSTYADALPLMVNPKTQRVHTSYNQAITSTGRLSSNNPNLQNIPIKTEEGRKIRQAFIAPNNHKIVSADYSQIELRIMAHLSKDPGLLKAFAQGIDIHSATAAEVFGVALQAVTSEMRRHAKAINFGLLYGMSAFGLAKQLGVPRDKAQAYMDLYFARYPNVRAYMDSARESAKTQGYVETLLGRKLYVPDIQASNHMRRMAAERAAINAPLQGTAADLIKLAMIAIDRQVKQHAVMVMQVHDELVFEVHEDHISPVCDLIKNCMENAFTLDVPLEVAIGVGENWDEAH
jgi:DNA polymerase-1